MKKENTSPLQKQISGGSKLESTNIQNKKEHLQQVLRRVSLFCPTIYTGSKIIYTM